MQSDSAERFRAAALNENVQDATIWKREWIDFDLKQRMDGFFAKIVKHMISEPFVFKLFLLAGNLIAAKSVNDL